MKTTLQHTDWPKPTWVWLLAVNFLTVLHASATLRSWTGGGTDAFWGTAANWAPAGTPQNGDDLVFPAGAAQRVNTNSLVFRTFNSITFNGAGGGYVLRGNGISLSGGISAQNTSGGNTISLIMSLVSGDQTFATTTALGTLAIDGNVNLNGHNLTLRANTAALSLGGVISGTGNLTKTGSGTLTLYGTSPNTYTGSLTVNGGLVQLWKVPGPAVTADLTTAGGVTIHSIAADQLSDTGAIVLGAGSLLELGGYSDTVGPITMTSSTIRTSGGLLTLGGNITNHLSVGDSVISGRLNLGTTSRVFHTDPDPALDWRLRLSAAIEGGFNVPRPGITFGGGGDVELSGANTYYGTTTIQDVRTLTLKANTALGDTLGGTVFQDVFMVVLEGVQIGTENLTVNGLATIKSVGACSWAGDISLAASADLQLLPNSAGAFTLSGSISGDGSLLCTGLGEIRFSGTSANSYTGRTLVNDGVNLVLAKPGLTAIAGPLRIGTGGVFLEDAVVRLIQVNQIANTAPVEIFKSGLLLLEGPSSDTIGSLTLDGGHVRTETGTLTLNGDVTASACFEDRPARIAGKLSLGGATRTFHLDQHFPAWVVLEVDAAIIGTGGLTFTGTGQLNLNSSNSYAGLTTVAGEVLCLGHASALGSASAGTIVSNGACLYLPGDLSVSDESLILNGHGPNTLYGALRGYALNSWTGPITLASDAMVTVFPTNGILNLTGAITGPGGLQKVGGGELCLSGTGANSYAGTTWVDSGTLSLSKPGLVTVPGPLVIGDGEGGLNADVVRVTQSNQIADTSEVRVNHSGLFWLDHSGPEIIGPLTLEGGRVFAFDPSLLILGGDVTTLVATNPAAICGRVSLGDVTRRFDVAQSPLAPCLWIPATIRDGSAVAGIRKTGPGDIWIEGENTYRGTTSIDEGKLVIYTDTGLGATSQGTVINTGGVLHVAQREIVNESLTINSSYRHSLILIGPLTWTGPVILNTNAFVRVADSVGISGVISGNGSLTKFGEGTLTISGALPNTYSAPTHVEEGILELAKTSGNAIRGPLVIGDNGGGPEADVVRFLASDQIDAATAQVIVNSSGLVDLNGHSDSVGRITLNGGRITTGSGTLWQYDDIVANAHTSQVARIEGRLLLNNNRTITVAGHHLTPDLEITAFIYGTGSLTKTGDGVLRLAGSNAYTGFTHADEGALLVDHSWALGDASQGTDVRSNAVLSLRGGVTIQTESLNLNSAGSPAFQSLFGSNTWSGPITLQRDTMIWIRTNDWLNLSGDINGPAGFTKIGRGTLLLSGSATNTYAGTTRVYEGVLELGKTGAGVDKAISAGSLVIGDGTGGADADRVLYRNGYQIGGIPITVTESGLLDLNHFNDLIGALTLQGGHVTSGTGLLTLGANLTAAASSALSVIEGRLSVGSGALAFNVAPGPIAPNLAIPASITDVGNNASLTITGGGDVRFEGSNSFRGTLTIENGTLGFYESTGLGTTNGGTIVNANGALFAHTVDVGQESLAINTDHQINFYGPSSWAGPITLGDNPCWIWTSGDVRFTGPIRGPGSLFKAGDGTLHFEGDATNTYAGTTFVYGGTLQLNRTGIDAAVPGNLLIGYPHGGSPTGLVRVARSEQISDVAHVTIHAIGKLEFAVDGWEVIDRLTGSGDLELGSADLYVGQNNFSDTFGGAIRGGPASEFHKTGTGTLTLTGTSPLRGTTYVEGGRLLVNGLQSSNTVSVGANGVLGGSGTVGNLLAVGGVSPGASPGILTSSNLTLTGGAELFIELNGPAPGSGYDQLNTRGSNFLGNPFLRVSASYPPAEGDAFVILQNDGTDPVSGTFAFLDEGALTTASNGLPLRVSYCGGDGNDVTLTVAPLALAVASVRVESGNGNASLDPDECDLLTVVLTNLTTAEVTSVWGALQSSNPAVAIPQPASPYPTIPAGGTATNRFPFQVMTSPTLPCGPDAEFEMQINTGNQGYFRTPFTLPTGVAGDPRRMDQNLKTPLADGASVTSSVVVTRMPTLATTTVAVYVEHPRADELDLFLLAPDGTKIELSTDNGKDANFGTSCADKDRTWFDDLAPRPIMDGTAPFVGRFQPESPFAALRGKSGTAINGTWNLVVADDTANGSAGTLWCWSLLLHPLTCPSGGGPCELCPSYFDIRGTLTGSDPVQAGPLLSDGMPSACGAAKDCPGLQDTLPRRYDAWVFANGPSIRCIEVELLSLCGNQVFSAAYLGPFQEANPCAGYLADGGGAGSRSYAFDVAANSLFTVVVSEAVTNASCSDYVLRVHGGDCQPVLHIAPASAGQAVLDWTSSAVGYQLEGTPSLAPSDFQSVLPLPVVIDGKNTVTNPVASPTRFYRLHKP